MYSAVCAFDMAPTNRFVPSRARKSFDATGEENDESSKFRNRAGRSSLAKKLAAELTVLELGFCEKRCSCFSVTRRSRAAIKKLK